MVAVMIADGVGEVFVQLRSDQIESEDDPEELVFF